MSSRRVGIYSGTFDPVHAGHLAFALQAQAAAGLDAVYFLPERRPAHKQGVEHFGHRVAMLRQAIKPYKQFEIMELEDISFSVQRTLPKLEHRLAGDQLVFLLGSDAVQHITDWPYVVRLLAVSELVVGVRLPQSLEEIKQLVESWTVQPLATTVFESYAAGVSSSRVREALRTRKKDAPGLLTSVERYSNRHWLYVSVGES